MGNPDEDSDLDLLVIVDKIDSSRYSMLVQGHKALGDLRFAKGLLLYSKEEFKVLSEDEMALCYKVKHEGIQIYAKA